MSFSQLILLTVLHHILFRIYIWSFFFLLSSSLLSLSSIPHTSYYPPFRAPFIILHFHTFIIHHSSHILLSSVPHTSYCLPFHTPFIILHNSRILLSAISHTSYYPPLLSHFITFYSLHLLLSSIPHYYPPFFTPLTPSFSYRPSFLTSPYSRNFFSVAFCSWHPLCTLSLPVPFPVSSSISSLSSWVVLTPCYHPYHSSFTTWKTTKHFIIICLQTCAERYGIAKTSKSA